MSDTNIIKSITQHSCPKCGEELYVESQMTPPVVAALFTPKDVEVAKKDCLERVETLAIDDERKKAVVKWLEDKETVFGPLEVENIILSLLKPE